MPSFLSCCSDMENSKTILLSEVSSCCLLYKESEIDFYSLTPPAEILLMMYLEQKQNTTSMGITEIATAKYMAP